MGNIEIRTKFSRLKSVSSIEDDYLIILLLQQFVFGCLFTITKKNNDLSVKKMFIEIRLCNRMTYVFKGRVKKVKIHMVKFNISILKSLKIMVFR